MVPEGWTEQNLDEVFKLTSGTKKPDDVTPEQTELTPYPVYGGNGVLGYSGQTNHQGNVIIIGRVGEYCGVTRLVEEACWITDNALYARDFYDANNINFTTYRLQHFDLSNLRSKGGQPLVSQKPIYATRFALPPLAEQRKIADILSTWDRAIETTEALLATARTQKRALMQSLLTGKRRFPEFEGEEWKEVRLGELGIFKKGKGIPKSEVLPEGEFPCVLYGELYTTYGETIDDPVSYTDLDDGVVSRAGDVLIPASTTTTGIDLAIASAVRRDNVRLGGDINIFRRTTNDIEGDFLAYFLTHLRKHEMARFAQGITIVHLKGSDLLGIKISVPPISEQRQIMRVVENVEREIVNLRSKSLKLRTEKKALMQQLLTGKRRVVVEDDHGI